jgi:hypothetical protein
MTWWTDAQLCPCGGLPRPLLDEVWDDIRCTDNCDPTTPGITLIEVPQDTTVVADFILDPEVAFKDSFE